MVDRVKPGLVLFAKDLEVVAGFYEGLVTPMVVTAQRDHVVLESEAFQLVVLAIPRATWSSSESPSSSAHETAST